MKSAEKVRIKEQATHTFLKVKVVSLCLNLDADYLTFETCLILGRDRFKLMCAIKVVIENCNKYIK